MSWRSGGAHIGLVVEGPGDERAIPFLLRRHLEARGDYRDVLGKPVPLNGCGNAYATGGAERYAAVAARPGAVGVMVFLDADKRATCEAGPELQRRVAVRLRVPVYICLAERAFEDWLYASAETLDIGVGAFDADKSGLGVIKKALEPGSYLKPVWQPRLTAWMDIGVAAGRCPSLARALRYFDSLCELLPDGR